MPEEPNCCRERCALRLWTDVDTARCDKMSHIRQLVTELIESQNRARQMVTHLIQNQQQASRLRVLIARNVEQLEAYMDP